MIKYFINRLKEAEDQRRLTGQPEISVSLTFSRQLLQATIAWLEALLEE